MDEDVARDERDITSEEEDLYNHKKRWNRPSIFRIDALDTRGSKGFYGDESTSPACNAS